MINLIPPMVSYSLISSVIDHNVLVPFTKKQLLGDILPVFSHYGAAIPTIIPYGDGANSSRFRSMPRASTFCCAPWPPALHGSWRCRRLAAATPRSAVPWPHMATISRAGHPKSSKWNCFSIESHGFSFWGPCYETSISPATNCINK